MNGITLIEGPDAPCISCQVEPFVLARTATREMLNHWMLWGCTCDPDTAADAEAFMDLITR